MTSSLSANLPHGLAAGTLVTTPDGDKKIEEVKAGDLVLSGVGDYKTDFYEVKKASSKPYRGPMLRIMAGRSNHQFRATPNHICFGVRTASNSSTYIEPEQDSVLLWAFDRFAGSRIAHSICKESDVGDIDGDPPQRFTNLDEAESSAHQLAQSLGGVEVHRGAFFVRGILFGFKPAIDLKVAHKIPVVLKDKSVARASITNITEEQYDGLVYDLDIPEARNFAANGVLVHNSIYAWRGADDPFILRFKNHHPDVQIVRLEHLSRAEMAGA